MNFVMVKKKKKSCDKFSLCTADLLYKSFFPYKILSLIRHGPEKILN